PTDVVLLKEAIKLHKLAVELSVVDDGQKALDFILRPEQGGERTPDILVIDLNLPKRSGLEVLQQLRRDKRYEDLHVVIFTSSDSASDRDSAAALGITHYFRKPPKYEKFLEI